MKETITYGYDDKKVTAALDRSFVDFVYEEGFEEGRLKGFSEGRTTLSYWWIGLAWLGWFTVAFYIGIRLAS